VFLLSDINKLNIIWVVPFGFLLIKSIINKMILKKAYDSFIDIEICNSIKVYNKYYKTNSAKDSFVKTLDKRYRPPLFKDLLDEMSEEEKNIKGVEALSATQDVIVRTKGVFEFERIYRYLGLLGAIGLNYVWDDYEKESRAMHYSNDHAQLAIFLFGSGKFASIKKFDLNDLVYCLFFIEQPGDIDKMSREEYEEKISKFIKSM